VVQQSINLVALDPGTLRPGNTPQSPRPGANLAATVTSSDPKVMAVTTPSVPIPIPQFGNSSPVIGVQPVSQGTAIVTISLAGNPPPEYDNQILFDVTEPALTIPAITIGQDLQAPAQISLGSAIATPAADLKISVYGGTNSLSNDPAAVGQGSIQVIIPAGKRISNPFYVQGMSPGTSALNYSVLGSSESYSTPVVVTQTAFVIQEAANGPLNLSAGTTSSLTVVPTLSPPLSGAPAVSWTIRPGAQPITISIASSNTAVATTSPAQVTFKPGDQKQTFTVQGLAAGTTTIQLLGFNYDFSQPQSSIAVTVK
ncbi:MAG TPA: hypothetical protein VKT81_00610, partial [Bryobacteraceae bacterium]|nr:hypothetical protein [Bryobacteraceae bacterium]